MFSERYRPHDELIVYTRRKRSVNEFFRWAMGILTGVTILMFFAASRGGCSAGMGGALALLGCVTLMPVFAIAWVIALLCVSHAKFRPLWKCVCGYDLRGTMSGGVTRCPECGRITTK